MSYEEIKELKELQLRAAWQRKRQQPKGLFYSNIKNYQRDWIMSYWIL